MSISGKVDPVVRRITAADVVEALGKGLRDFQAAPVYGLTCGALYAFGGILIVLCVTGAPQVMVPAQPTAGPQVTLQLAAFPQFTSRQGPGPHRTAYGAGMVGSRPLVLLRPRADLANPLARRPIRRVSFTTAWPPPRA